MSDRQIVVRFLWVIGLWAVVFIVAIIGALAPSLSQPYGGPPMWDRGPNPEYRQERRLPPRTYDPYDRGPERFGPPPPRGLDRGEYERRSFCAMHPRECP